MRKVLKVMLLIVGVGAFLLIGTGVALAATVLHSGVVMVKVHDKTPGGVNLTLPVPATLLHIGMTTALQHTDEIDRHQLREQLRPYRPALTNSLDQLRAAEDFTMVEVSGGDEYVSVRKKGDSWIVQVESDEADVYVSLPLGLLDSALSALGG